jgi:hypothetical protein
MIASASRLDPSKWCRCVGDCMMDCAFLPIPQEDARLLHSHLSNLCHLVPELGAACSQAKAPLRAVLNM